MTIDKKTSTPTEFDRDGVKSVKCRSPFDEYQILSILARDSVRFLPVEIKSIIKEYCAAWKHKKIKATCLRAAAMSRNGKFVAIAMNYNHHGFIMILDITTDTCVRVIRNVLPVKIKFSGDGTKLAWLESNNEISMIDIQTGQMWPVVRGADCISSRLFVNEDGDRVTSVNLSENPHITAIIRVDDKFSPMHRTHFHYHSIWGANCCLILSCMSDCGSMIAGWSAPHDAVVWEDQSEAKAGMVNWSSHEDIMSIVISSSRKMVATGSAKGCIQFTSINGQDGIKKFETHHKKNIHSLAFSSDDKILAAAGDGVIILLNVETLIQISYLISSVTRAKYMFFSEDSSALMCEGMDAVEVWKLK